MKKIIIVAVCAFCALTASAQRARAHLLHSSQQRRLMAAFSLVSVPVSTWQVWPMKKTT